MIFSPTVKALQEMHNIYISSSFEMMKKLAYFANNSLCPKEFCLYPIIVSAYINKLEHTVIRVSSVRLFGLHIFVNCIIAFFIPIFVCSAYK